MRKRIIICGNTTCVIISIIYLKINKINLTKSAPVFPFLALSITPPPLINSKTSSINSETFLLSP